MSFDLSTMYCFNEEKSNIQNSIGIIDNNIKLNMNEMSNDTIVTDFLSYVPSQSNSRGINFGKKNTVNGRMIHTKTQSLFTRVNVEYID